MKRSAFVAGNVGRLGEELLHLLVERADYERITVGVARPLTSIVGKYVPAVMTAEQAPAVMATDLILCVERSAGSYWKLPAPYVSLTAAQATAIALVMAGRGAERLLLVTPMEALMQMGHAGTLPGLDEAALGASPLRRVVVLRPSEQDRATSPASLPTRVAAGVLHALGGIMTPRHLLPMGARRVAEVALHALASYPDGMHVLGSSRLHRMDEDGEPPRVRRRPT